MSDSSLLALTWPSDLLNSPLVFRLGWVILHTLWQFLAIALVAAVIYSALKGGSATARYLTLMMATGLMAAAPLLTWFTIEPPRSAVSTEHESPPPKPPRRHLRWPQQSAQTGLQRKIHLPHRC